jgi:hypothetical protein
MKHPTFNLLDRGNHRDDLLDKYRGLPPRPRWGRGGDDVRHYSTGPSHVGKAAVPQSTFDREPRASHWGGAAGPVWAGDFRGLFGSKRGENPLWSGLVRFSPVCVEKNNFCAGTVRGIRYDCVERGFGFDVNKINHRHWRITERNHYARTRNTRTGARGPSGRQSALNPGRGIHPGGNKSHPRGPTRRALDETGDCHRAVQGATVGREAAVAAARESIRPDTTRRGTGFAGGG